MPYSKARQKLRNALTTTTQHYKLYKSGSHWLLMGLTTITLGFVGVTTNAAAATTAATPATTQTAPASTAPTSAATSQAPASQSASSAATPASAATPTQATDVTNLGAASANDVTAAKSAAANIAATTGQAQQVTAASAAASTAPAATDAPATDGITPTSTADTTAAPTTGDTAAADTTPTTDIDAADTTAELATLTDTVKQAMAINDVDYYQTTTDDNNTHYYFWGTFKTYNKTTDAVKSSTVRGMSESEAVISTVQALTNSDQLLQKLAAEGITASILTEPIDDDGAGAFAGTTIPTDYATAPASTQTVTYIDDSNQATLAAETDNSNVDLSSSIADEVQALHDSGFIEVSDNYQAPTATMSVDNAVTTIQTELNQLITAYNQVHDMDYQLKTVETAGNKIDGVPVIQYRFLLTSTKAGHLIFDSAIQSQLDTAGQNAQLTQAGDRIYSDAGVEDTLNLTSLMADNGFTSFHMRLSKNSAALIAQSKRDWADDSVAGRLAVQQDVSNLMAALKQDTNATAAIEALRENGRIFSIAAAPLYDDTTFTFTSTSQEWKTDANGDPIIDPDTNEPIMETVYPTQNTVTVIGYTADDTLPYTDSPFTIIDQTFMGIINTKDLADGATNTTYQVHFQEVNPDNGVQTRTQIPDGATVNPDDYYDFTVPGTVGDGVQVKTQVPEGVSVTPDDYYDFTVPGTVGDGVQVKTQVPEGVSVTPDDYYNNTIPGKVDDGVQVKAQVPEGVSVTPDDYYDNTVPGKVDAGVRVKTQVPEGVSVTPDNYYDNRTPGIDAGVRVKTQVPAGVSVTPADYYDNRTPNQPAGNDNNDQPDQPATTATPAKPAGTTATDQPATPATATPAALTATTGNTSITPTAAPKAATTPTSATTLPQTGSADDVALLVGGLTILGSIGLLGAAEMRKRRDGFYQL